MINTRLLRMLYALPVLLPAVVACAQPSLKGAYEKRFKIGAAVNEAQVAGKPAADSVLLLRHFNAVTPENIMKAEVIHPQWMQYRFAPADALVAFARRHGLQLNGHT
ncbi:MAG: endo-1,4-beta-xylanase, partial [Chitinophagaceae bacterium]|nr:endo-1,4-beta-xylanase [Chitinophagaceae bacterium]